MGRFTIVQLVKLNISHIFCSPIIEGFDSELSFQLLESSIRDSCLVKQPQGLMLTLLYSQYEGFGVNEWVYPASEDGEEEHNFLR